VITVCNRTLNFDGTLGRFQRAVELDQKCVTNGFYFSAVKPREDFPKQPAMFLQQFLGKLLIALAERAVAHHVGEHDRREFSLFPGITHNWWRLRRFSSANKLRLSIR